MQQVNPMFYVDLNYVNFKLYNDYKVPMAVQIWNYSSMRKQAQLPMTDFFQAIAGTIRLAIAFVLVGKWKAEQNGNEWSMIAYSVLVDTHWSMLASPAWLA